MWNLKVDGHCKKKDIEPKPIEDKVWLSNSLHYYLKTKPSGCYIDAA